MFNFWKFEKGVNVLWIWLITVGALVPTSQNGVATHVMILCKRLMPSMRLYWFLPHVKGLKWVGLRVGLVEKRVGLIEQTQNLVGCGVAVLAATCSTFAHWCDRQHVAKSPRFTPNQIAIHLDSQRTLHVSLVWFKNMICLYNDKMWINKLESYPSFGLFGLGQWVSSHHITLLSKVNLVCTSDLPLPFGQRFYGLGGLGSCFFNDVFGHLCSGLPRCWSDDA